MKKLFLFALLVALPLTAQENFKAEFASPAFDQTDFDAPSGVFFFHLTKSAVGLNWFGELAFSRFEVAGQSESHFGNPAIGLKFGRERNGFSLSANLPVGGADNFAQAASLAAFADERFESFIPNALPIKVSAYRAFAVKPGYELRVKGSLLALYAYEQNPLDRAFSFYLPFNLASVNNFGGFEFGVAVSGNYFMSETQLNLAAATVFQVEFFTGYKLGRLKPMVGLKLPLDDDTAGYLRRTLRLGLSGSF